MKKDFAIKQFKKKNEMDAEAELGEDEIEKIEKELKLLSDFSTFFNDLACENYNCENYTIDALSTSGEINKTIDSIFNKKVFCLHLTGDSAKYKNIYQKYQYFYANICTRNNIAFVDVRSLIHEIYESCSENKCILNNFELNGCVLKSQFKMRCTEAPEDFPSNYTPDIIISIVKQYLTQFRNCPK